MPYIYNFVDYRGEEVMVRVGWIVHLIGPWYLQWRLGKLRIMRRPKGGG